MSGALGQTNLCGFCGEESGVVSEQLGDMEVHICANCLATLNAGAARQMVDAANVAGAVTLKDKKLVVQLFGFKRLIDIGSDDAALVAGQISDFFSAMREAISSGKLAEMKVKQEALKKLREEKREAEKSMSTLTAEVAKARVILVAAEKKLSESLAEKTEAENQLEAAQSAEELKRQLVRASENEDLRLVNELKQALDALGASGLF